jgi:hypothetical protein
MFNFFSDFSHQDVYRKSIQLLNLTALAVATYDLYQNPEKLSTIGLAIFARATNFICMDSNTTVIKAVLASNLNFLQLGAVLQRATSTCPDSQVSLGTLLANAALHTTSGFSTMFNMG